MLESLGASQVLSYLYELSNEYEYYLVSLEKSADFYDQEKIQKLKTKLDQFSIHWFPIEYKNGAINYLGNFYRTYKISKKIVKDDKVDFLHVRSYLPALIALFIKKQTNVSYLFDTRGFWFDEKVDTKRWTRNGIIFKFSKKIEKLLFTNAKASVLLSKRGIEIIKENKLFKGGNMLNSLYMIPTCTNLNSFVLSEKIKKEKLTIGYVGTVSGWYDFESTAKVLNEFKKQEIAFHLKIFNKKDESFIKEVLTKYGFKFNEFEIESVPFDDMPKRMQEIDLSLFFIKPLFSKQASAATKLGELMASGIPVITNGNVGDHQYFIEKFNVGKIIDLDNISEYNFKSIIEELNQNEIKTNCRNLAEEVFSLEKGVEEYRKIYKLF